MCFHFSSFSSSSSPKDDDSLKYYEMYNLTGGIFKWMNDGYSVYNEDNQITDRCHPYNKVWGRLLNKQFHPSE